jgi:hypothetical protein
MDGWMDRWMDGWMDRWMDGWIGKRASEWIRKGGVCMQHRVVAMSTIR